MAWFFELELDLSYVEPTLDGIRRESY